MATHTAKRAKLYRMVTAEHICPFGLKARALLKRKGYEVEDHWLENREEIDAFKAQHHVRTTPQTFIDAKQIGGYDELVEHFGGTVKDKDAVSYTPVIALLMMAALMALAVSWATFEQIVRLQTLEWFIAIAMCLLAVQKLKDVDGFATMFLNYDLLAQRWVRYAYLYPFGEALAGVLMLAGAMLWLSVPIALVIGSIGAWSVFKAVYIDKRELKCACVGGDSKVPLGFVSLTENLMMVAMAVWMMIKPFLLGT